MSCFSDPNLPEWTSSNQDRNNIYYGEDRWPKYNMSTQSYLHINNPGKNI